MLRGNWFFSARCSGEGGGWKPGVTPAVRQVPEPHFCPAERTARRQSDAAPALRATPIEPGHLCIESRLIDEDQAPGIPLRLLAAPPKIGFGLLIQRTFSGVFLIFVLRQLIEAS